MKLLIVTQVVDQEHPVLGFFHGWLAEFAKRCEQVHVIALQVGTHDLPANVHVHSLGKESGKNRLKYLWRFYRYIWQLRHQYDNVFVHMNQVYVILGGPVWRLWGKSIGLWYMHGTVSNSLWVAEKLTNNIFTGSPESFRLPSKKVVVTGHGIDTSRFVSSKTIVPDLDLITVGRITPSKNLDYLVEVLTQLADQTVTLTICGEPLTPAEKAYKKLMQQNIAAAGLVDRVVWLGRVAQTELPAVLQRARLFVTAAQNGSLDKAVLEAMACGLPVVSAAPGTQSLPLGQSQVSSQSQFIVQINNVLQSTDLLNYGDYIDQTHSLQSLIPNILTHLSHEISVSKTSI